MPTVTWYSSAGPMPQVAPTTSAPAAISRAAVSAGAGPPPRLRFGPANHLPAPRDPRPALLGDADRHLELEDRRERLEQDRVDAGEHEGVDLLGEREPRQPALRRARDAVVDAARADRAGDVRALARRRARELD